VNNTYGNVTVEVRVTDDSGSPVTTGQVSLTYANGTVIAVVDLVDGVDGRINISIPSDNLDDILVNATYLENPTYLSSVASGVNAPEGMENTTNITVEPLTPTVTVDIDKTNVTIGDTVTINGTATNTTGGFVPKGTEVIVSIGGVDYTVEVMDDEGHFEKSIEAITTGTFTANATYDGVTSDNVYYTVSKIPTTTNVTILNHTAGNVTIGVNVTNLTGYNVIMGNVTIYDSDYNQLANATLNNGLANVTLPINTAGKVSIIVTYNENDIYNSSNAKNSSAIGKPTEELISFDVVQQNTTVTINLDKDNVTIGDIITINGTVTNQMGEIITSGTVTVNIDGDEYTVDIIDGTYTLTNTTVKAGIQTINATYNGQEGLYNPSTSDNKNLTVNKKPVNIIATQEGNTPGNVTLSINVTDVNGENVEEGTVIITLPNGTNITANVINGTANVTLDTIPGTIEVNVTFVEDDIYQEANTTQSITTVQINSTISLDDIDEVTIGDNVTITGTLTDQNDKPIANANVTVTVNGVDYNVTTNPNGEYEYVYTTDVAGVNNVTVVYEGDVIYNSSTNATDFNVAKKDVNITVVQVGDTPGNVTLNISVVDKQGNPVPNGTIIVKLPNGTQIPVNITGGVATVPLDTTAGSLDVEVLFNEADEYNKANTTTTVITGKINSTLTVDDIDNVTVGETVTISGKLVDQYDNPIAGANITVLVNGESHNTTTDENGRYELPYTAKDGGVNNITVKYAGDEIYAPADNETEFNVKVNTLINSTQTGQNVGNVTVKVNVTDVDGNKIPNGTVIVKDDDGNVIAVGNITGGTADIILDLPAGDYNITLEYSGDKLYNPVNMTMPIKVYKNNANITLNPIKNITYYQATAVAGKLTDSMGNPIPYANVTLDFDGITQVVPTDGQGNYLLVYNTTKVGLNNVTASFKGNDVYNSATTNGTFNASKIHTRIVIDDVVGVLGDNVTLNALVTDEYGTKVTGGQFAFKVDGLTLRTNGKFEENGTVWIFSPVDGRVNVTLTADTYLKYAKNVSGVYGETGKYYASRANAKATIYKRNAVINVTTVNRTKQDTDIIFTARVSDVTGGTFNGPVREYEDNYVIFKLNGVTLKDEDGNAIKVKVKDGVANITYHVPIGLAGVYPNLSDRYYNVTAVFGSEEYYPDVINSTLFKVDRSPIHATNSSVTLNNTTRTVNICTDLVDYHNNSLIGNNTICVKINGETYKINNKTVYYNVEEGHVNVTVPVSYNVNKVNSVEVVTGQRCGYLGGRFNLSEYIDKSNTGKIGTRIIVDNVVGTIGENITLKATVLDEDGKKVTGGQFTFKVNGLTLRTDGTFSSTGKAWILSPIDGRVNVTITADTYLKNAANITGVYGENTHYYASRSQKPGLATIHKRDARITVTTVNTTKQDVNITFTATLRDVTHGRDNGPVYDYDDNFVVFKVNGLTLKDEKGNTIKAKVQNGKAKATYHVPAGLAGIYTNQSIKYYNVTAVFGNEEYNTVQNSTQFSVNRSNIKFKNTNVTLNKSSNRVSIKSDIVDYHNNLLKGKNTLCVKFNDLTYKIDNKTVYYQAVNGKVNINIKLPYNVDKISNIKLVTGERVGYLDGRTTITNFKIVQ
jgi:hypothetical protein